MTERHGYSETDYADALESGHVPAPEAEEASDTVETAPEAAEPAQGTGTPLFDETSKADGEPGE